MSATQIAMKHVSLAARIKSVKMQRGNMSDDDLNRLHVAVKDKYNANFLINEFAGTDFDKFKIQLRHAVRKNNIKVVFHDYIQQMYSESNKYQSNRVAELSKISNEIKSLARELNIVVVCLAQLNRQAEVLSDTDQPSISHIKDSGAMEQDADCVMIIHRKRSETTGDVEIIVAKNRHSATTSAKSGQIFLKSDLSINKFFE
jgi:replicative DNA helicase